MPRQGTIIFRDMAASSLFSASNAQVRPQRGRYYLHRLIERYGIDCFRLVERDHSRLPEEKGAEFERPVPRPMPGPVEGYVKPSGAPGLCVWAQSRSGAKFAPCFRSA